MSLVRDFYRDVRRYFRGTTRGRSRALPALIWLAFILFPLADGIGMKGPVVGHVLTIAGAAAFVVAYVWLVLVWKRRSWRKPTVALFTVLIGMSVVLTLASGPGWGFLFTYCAAVVALYSPTEVGWAGVFTCAALAVACSAIAGASGSAVFNYAVTALGIGLLMVLMRDLRIRNDELSEARAELAQAAVAQERERFARDLHDLLGHTLSVIALKAELAGRLIPHRPDQAAAEVGEVEQVARNTLGEVRLAVSGYRQPTLEGELAGARMALSAAGITADIDAPTVTFPPDVEAVLAWAVREGATNVIRHSHATKCAIRVGPGLPGASVEVINDRGRRDAPGAPAAHVSAGSSSGARPQPSGSGPHAMAAQPATGTPSGAAAQTSGRSASAAGPGTAAGGGGGGHTGHGLEGLRERAEAIGGRVEAGPLPDGGFKLALSVPVRAPGPAPSAEPFSPPTASPWEPGSPLASPDAPTASRDTPPAANRALPAAR